MEPVSEHAFVEFFRYNQWANQQILQACQALSEAELDTPVPGAYGTVRETLEHIVRSEGGYLRQLTGVRPQPAFRWEDRPTVSAMAAYAAEVGEGLIEAARSLDPMQLVGSNWNGQATTFRALAVFI